LVACEEAVVRVVNVGCGDNQAISSTTDFLSSLEFEYTSVKRNNGVRWTKRVDEYPTSLELTMPEVSLECSAWDSVSSAVTFRRFEE